ncbi:hypothetical protein EDB92DRAFT_1953494 [Lactarius akahatsu]|uniref:Uncharacterized protein n=1 Tax=Lactarius akahatsu TaxID=416441 RepID=A0AAD4L783_9AGAM|nr:hypothetical protein EDB92DRAFT_1953494 [Lactarius akahatsu]
MSATKRVEDTPTTSEELKYMDARIDEEIVAIQKIFDTFKSSSKMPRVHPIIQAVGAEWKTASDAKRRFNWTEHPRVACVALITYTRLISGWSSSHEAVVARGAPRSAEDLRRSTNCSGHSRPASPHPPSPPAHSHNTRGKGKRAVNAQRRADPDNPEGESDSTTPQKSDLPRVEVAQASPPRPTQRQRTEASATIAYEQDRCAHVHWPTKWSAGLSQIRAHFRVCAVHRSTSRGLVARGSPAMWEARLDARLDAQEQRMEAMDAVNRDNNEKLARILLELQNTRQDSHDTRLMISRLLNNQGVDVLSIPGVGATPYNRRYASPMTSTSSVGAQMSGLGILMLVPLLPSLVCLRIAVANHLGEALLLEDVVAQWDVRPQWTSDTIWSVGQIVLGWCCGLTCT